jgi:hypothetical protein
MISKIPLAATAAVKRVVSRSFATSNANFPSETTVVFFSNHIPEPNASAAGVRTQTLIHRLQESDGIHHIHYTTGTAKTLPDASGNVTYHFLPPNESTRTRKFLSKIKSDNMIVVFDRFYVEEMYSFAVRQHLPHALRVTDMQDFHALRSARQDDISTKTTTDYPLEPSLVTPTQTSDMLLRELASIHRSDLTLVCSPFEVDLLATNYQIPRDKLALAPLLFHATNNNETSTSADELLLLLSERDNNNRSGFVMCGGFQHPPNVDAMHTLRERIWPRLRDQLLPGAACHVYGANCPVQYQRRITDATWKVHGFEQQLATIFGDKRVLLAPLRYGAGLKGKIVDAWKFGVPVVTTSVGAEGLWLDGFEFGGRVADTEDEFVAAAVELYESNNNEQRHWEQARTNASQLLEAWCKLDDWDVLAGRLIQAMEEREFRRSTDYVQAVLWHQNVRSTEYFSKFLELKRLRDMELKYERKHDVE